MNRELAELLQAQAEFHEAADKFEASFKEVVRQLHMMLILNSRVIARIEELQDETRNR